MRRRNRVRPINFAHRGASAYCPENTFAAFEKAIELGATGIETDIQMTSDGHLVLIHDESVNRTTNGKGWVKNFTLYDLKKLDAGKWFHPSYAGEKIPTLEELILWAKHHQIWLNLELKNGTIPYQGMEEKVIHCIRTYRMDDQVIISSFNHQSLVRCKEILPIITTGLLFGEVLTNLWNYTVNLKINTLHPNKSLVSESFVKLAHAYGLRVFPWTVNKKAAIKRILGQGADGLITDYPERVNLLL